jgi:hypothetical protein
MGLPNAKKAFCISAWQISNNLPYNKRLQQTLALTVSPQICFCILFPLTSARHLRLANLGIKVQARVSYYAGRWYVHVASAFPLSHHYLAALGWSL